MHCLSQTLGPVLHALVQTPLNSLPSTPFLLTLPSLTASLALALLVQDVTEDCLHLPPTRVHA